MRSLFCILSFIAFPFFVTAQDCYYGGTGSGHASSHADYCMINPAFISDISGDGFDFKGVYYCADGARYTSSGIGSGLSRSEVWYCDTLGQLVLFHSSTVYSSGFGTCSVGYCQPFSFIGGLSGQGMSSVKYCSNISFIGSGASGWNTGIAFCQDPLPVELLSFTAVKTGGSALLLWQTATEINNNYFRIEKSVDGFHFSSIGIIFGAGNSNQLLDYSFIDATPVSGINYYRLAQVDFDGTEHLSQVIAIDFSGVSENYNISVYPNPLSWGNTLNIVVTPEEQGLLQISDINGRIIYADRVTGGDQPVRLTTYSDLFDRGVYFITFVTGSSVYTDRFVIQ